MKNKSDEMIENNTKTQIKTNKISKDNKQILQTNMITKPQIKDRDKEKIKQRK